MNYQGVEALAAAVEEAQGGHLQICIPIAETRRHMQTFAQIHPTNGGGLCELGYLYQRRRRAINPHFDLRSKEEDDLVGSWVYNLRDYATTFDFLKRAKAIGLPMSELITHKFPLEQINEALETNLAMTGLKIAIVNE